MITVARAGAKNEAARQGNAAGLRCPPILRKRNPLFGCCSTSRSPASSARGCGRAARWGFRSAAVKDLLQIGERSNVALTQAFANSLWPRYAPFLRDSGRLSMAELKAHPQLAELHEAVLEHTRGLSVVKVKIYDLAGRTVYSSEPSRSATTSATTPVHLGASGVRRASHHSERQAFDRRRDRDVLPLRSGEARVGRIDGGARLRRREDGAAPDRRTQNALAGILRC